MQILLAIFLTLILFTNCSTIEIAITEKRELVQQMKNIAIIPFDFKGKPELGKEFSNSFAILSIKNDRIQIIERNEEELSKVMGEFKVSRSGLIDEATAATAGKILGVDVILIGFGETIEIDSKSIVHKFRIKAINVQTGTLIIGVIKEPGIEWTPSLLAKYILGLGLIWDKKDMLIESSSVKHLSSVTAEKILKAIREKDPPAKR
jgi:hypothetical protein